MPAGEAGGARAGSPARNHPAGGLRPHPGRLALLRTSQGKRLLLWADLLHGLDVQAAHPEIAIRFDLDPAAAIASRQALLARAATENWLVSGVHVPAPAVYALRAQGGGYAATPLPKAP